MFELIWDDSNQTKNGQQFVEPQEWDGWTSVIWSCCPVSLVDLVMQTNALPVWTYHMGYTIPLDSFASLCHSAQALGWAPQGANLPPALCRLWQHAQMLFLCHPTCGYCLHCLAIKAKCAGPASAGPLFSRQVEKDFLSSSSSFPQH